MRAATLFGSSCVWIHIIISWRIRQRPRQQRFDAQAGAASSDRHSGRCRVTQSAHQADAAPSNDRHSGRCRVARRESDIGQRNLSRGCIRLSLTQHVTICALLAPAQIGGCAVGVSVVSVENRRIRQLTSNLLAVTHMCYTMCNGVTLFVTDFGLARGGGGRPPAGRPRPASGSHGTPTVPARCHVRGARTDIGIRPCEHHHCPCAESGRGPSSHVSRQRRGMHAQSGCHGDCRPGLYLGGSSRHQWAAPRPPGRSSEWPGPPQQPLRRWTDATLSRRNRRAAC